VDTRYALLLLELPAGATRGDARRAYRRSAALTHPDVGGSAARFRLIAAAAAHLFDALPEGAPTQPRTRVRFAERPAALGIAPGGDYTPWSGADWTGAASGLAWTPTPAPARRRRSR
jgi:hypothetical protein